MIRRIAFGFTAALALATFLWLRQSHRPNVLIISVDALRADALSSYGGTTSRTPQMDALASAGVLFRQAVCDVPWTRPSLATLLTGRDAATHRVRSHIDRLRADLPMLPEVFQAAGYRTQAIVSAFELDSIYRLDRGFFGYDDTFVDPIVAAAGDRVHMASVYFGDASKDRSFRHSKLEIDAMRPDQQTADAAVGFLRREGGQPFFLWVHFFGPRERWPSGATPEMLVPAYPKGVEATDAQVGRVLQTLAQLGLQNRTIVVLHGTNGQSLTEHDLFGHGTDLYEPSLRVPLILSWPGHLPAGKQVAALASLADVSPTVTEMASLRPQEMTDGRSLLRLMDAPDSGDRRLYIETFVLAHAKLSQVARAPGEAEQRFGTAVRGMRTQRWKYIRSEPHGLIDLGYPAIVSDELRRSRRREELYDLQADPSESVNLVEREPEMARDFSRWVDDHVK
ncbi:MAG: sulfatase [Deltaproteobacteria bacterium]|nr:sulfatase [Deltaproteobacteria bacterium]